VKRKKRFYLTLFIAFVFLRVTPLFGFEEYFDEPEDEFRDEPEDEFRDEPEDEFRDEPEDEFRDEPEDEFRDEPVDEFRDEPVDEFRDEPADPFVKDEFVPEERRDEFVPPPEDDFVLEKREGQQTYRYREPDIGKVLIPTYLYQENSVQAKKVFELYKNDQVVVLEEKTGWFHVEFLGREGWVPIQDIRLEKWHSYRVSFELGGGAGSGGGDIKNFDVIGNYFFRLNVSIIQDIVVGVEGKGISFDSKALYAGGGIMLRYYIHGLRTKKTRSAVTLSGGYLGGLEKPSSSYEYQTGETQYKVFSGPYFGAAVDYYFRVWEHMAFGLGGHFNHVTLYGKTETTDLKKSFFQGGAHLSLIFNVLR
jgi:hypothetical protein